MRINKAVPIAASLILALPAFLAAAAQTSAQPDPTVVDQFSAPPSASQASTPTLHITTREVVVDVEVYDDAGNPVHGLTQSDFTIEENGKPQPLRTFREFSKSAQAAESASPKLPASRSSARCITSTSKFDRIWSITPSSGTPSTRSTRSPPTSPASRVGRICSGSFPAYPST